ncbi:MAG: hypothetical protein PWP51_3026 [Clostridiales bacterium]|jgi:5-bromo-4-chloroindolyl phosphate hydrolysis protein|nr:hypothetical protein [Clostridiales bacterium]MDN5300473.1 hypothetical protein [Clostridiales bacterium]
MKRNGMMDVLSGLVAGAVFLLFFFVIQSSLLIALGVGILSFIAGQLLFKKKDTEIEFVAEGITKAQIEGTVRQGQKKVRQIEQLNEKIRNPQLHDDIASICDTADAIFDNFNEDPKDVKAARKFLSYYLDTTIRILEQYVSISNKKVRGDDIDETLSKVEEMVTLIDETFKKQMKKLLEDDILDLDVELEILEKTIKSEGV